MQIILDLLSIFLLATIPATLNFFLDYCFGRPMSDQPSTNEIFSKYPFWLAERRVKQKGLYVPLYNSFTQMLNSDDPKTRHDGLRQFRLTVLVTGREFFNIEKALGMCPICTNFWCSQIVAMILFFTTPLTYINPIFYFLLIPIFSSTILRKL